ncbi:MAG TPA: hypothetical protein VEP66_20825 [Myxococcales bacterium]|nr:hypothetical protein [Myxococcales bacterium]
MAIVRALRASAARLLQDLADKSYFFASSHGSVVAYRIAVVDRGQPRDPVGPIVEVEQLLEAFMSFSAGQKESCRLPDQGCGMMLRPRGEPHGKNAVRGRGRHPSCHPRH